MIDSSILTEVDGAVGVVTLNRPKAMNALNNALTSQLSDALDQFEADDSIGAIVITGNQAAFAAGADIKEIREKTFTDVFSEQFITKNWERAALCRKPTIAAVSGYAVGGGFELAMMCDIIIASETAQFSLPETQVGIIPGAGGTQRLTRIAGKAIAMDMILSGRSMMAAEAKAHGLISRVSDVTSYLSDAIQLGQKIAKSSRPILMLAKEAVNHAHETHLSEGIFVERRLLYSAFATEDQKEGMDAFCEKRSPKFSNR